MKLHILRPLIVFVVLVGLILFARSLFLPKDFATNERGYRFGWHRFGNEQEWKDFPVKYVGSDTCTACHADKGTQILASWHKDNQCENCHGPYQEGHSKEWVFPSAFNILDYGYAGIDGLFMLAPFVFLFLIPAVTMRSFADEKKSGTIELLFTKPISDFNIILAKYFAGFIIVIISILPTLVYYITVYKLGMQAGNLDVGATWGSYIGLLFLGAAFTAVGIFCSSISENQIVSFILAIAISGFMYLGFEFIYSLEIFGTFGLFIQSLGLSDHYSSISRGVVDTRDLIYYFSFILIFLFSTRLVLQSRKW